MEREGREYDVKLCEQRSACLWHTLAAQKRIHRLAFSKSAFNQPRGVLFTLCSPFSRNNMHSKTPQNPFGRQQRADLLAASPYSTPPCTRSGDPLLPGEQLRNYRRRDHSTPVGRTFVKLPAFAILHHPAFQWPTLDMRSAHLRGLAGGELRSWRGFLFFTSHHPVTRHTRPSQA